MGVGRPILVPDAGNFRRAKIEDQHLGRCYVHLLIPGLQTGLSRHDPDLQEVHRQGPAGIDGAVATIGDFAKLKHGSPLPQPGNRTFRRRSGREVRPE
jgi:hypothetical protein